MAKKPSTAAKAPAKSKKSAANAPETPAGVPMIDTSLAAESAAKMLSAGLPRPTMAGDANASAKPESAAFKQMKAGLNKPTAAGTGGLLGNLPGYKKSNSSFGPGNQVGRNQTFGADVNRTGVPRRTGGG